MYRAEGSISLWMVLTVGIAMVILVPIGFVLSSLFADAGEIWGHLATTVLPRYLLNSLWLVLGVGAGVLILGVSMAWVVTSCQFPGRRMFEWALLLPLAAPAYVLAYTYTDFLQFSGPVQRTLRRIFDLQPGDYWFPDVRSLEGAILMLLLVLYPYVYLTARVAFLQQSIQTLEVSRSLGYGPWRSFLRVALPLARPAIIAGLTLALMETLNDYGTVDFFGVDTFTTGIHRTWYGLGERIAAAQLASVLLLLILLMIGVERGSRWRARYFQSSTWGRRLSPYRLTGIRALGAVLLCGIPIALGFVVPGMVLLYMTWDSWDQIAQGRFWQFAQHSLILALVTAILAAILAVIMAYGQRLARTWVVRWANQIAAMGYAVPGSVIAVGVLVPIGRLDNAVDAWMEGTFGISTGLLLSGTIGALVFAYLVRFLAVAFGSVEASLTQVRPSLDEAARSLGQGPTQTLLKIHGPLVLPGILTSMLVVFVDVMKELPATLVIRPFNFDTLAVRAYQLASDERLAEAAAPALAIVVVGILPVVVLSRQIGRS